MDGENGAELQAIRDHVARAQLSRRDLLRAGATAASLPLIGSFLAACGGSNTTGDVSTSGAVTTAAAPKIKPQADGDISWYTWAEYVDPKIVSSFEKEYGVKVKQSFFSTNAESLQKLATGVPYDLITTNNGFMPQTIAGGLVQSFDLGDLKNADQLVPYFEKPYWDAGQYRYTVPYGYGPTGIMYRTDKVGKKTDWKDFFETPEANGHIYLLSSMGDTLGMALLANGFDMNSGVADQVTKAADALVALKPNVASFTTDLATPIASGSAWLMEGWTTQVFQGQVQYKNPEDIGFFIPPTGSLLACDTLSVGAKAKAPGTALLFMDWILGHEQNYRLGEWCVQNTGAQGGQEAFRKAVKQYPDYDFSNDLLSVPNNWKIFPTGQRAQLWNSQWSRVIA
jgi:spermidine/putrescine transport system substrate-binding protein